MKTPLVPHPAKRYLYLPLLVATALGAGLAATNASTATWTGASSGAWSSNNNWVSTTGVSPVGAPASGNTAFFNNAVNTAVTVDNRQVNRIQFDPGAGAFTFSGGTFTFAGASSYFIQVSSGVTNTQTINTPTLLSSTANSSLSLNSFSTNPGVALVVGGSITGQQTAGNTSTVLLAGPGEGSVSGAISDGTGGGAVRVTISSGLWTLGGNSSYTSFTNVNGGTLAAGHNNAFGTSTLNLNAGTLMAADTDRALANITRLAANSTVSGTNNLTLSGTFTNYQANSTLTNNLTAGKTLTLSGTVALSESNTARVLTLAGSGATTISGPVINGGSGAGGLTYNGSGTLALTGASTYTGSTTVSAGTLLVNGSLGSSPVTVASGAILGGSGTLGGNVTIASGGTIAPGNSPGLLSISGDLTLSATSGVALEITGTTRGAAYNALNIGGTLTLDGNINVTSTYTFLAGDSFDLFNWGGLVDAGFALNLPTLGGGLSWDTSTFTTNGTVTVVPEPSSAGLAGLGLAMMLHALRRRRA